MVLVVDASLCLIRGVSLSMLRGGIQYPGLRFML